jgi:CheY-like chemotaxis protein/anti-sigma regulatory factor (Ser/Thr protein kinase)
MRANLAPVHLRSVIAHAVDTIWAPAEAKQIAIDIDIVGFNDAFLADADRLQQVIWNLFSNAVKFTPRGGTVVLRAREVEDMAVISVTDTGEGISPEFLPNVFERFRQADSSASRRHGGLGLGLAIVKSLVEMHGGTVQVESRGIGFGATFTVTLPMNPPDAQPSPARTAARGVTLENVSVLIVDDEPATRLMLQTALAHFAADVSVASSVREALETLDRSEATQVVISDIAMPGEDGYALLRELRGSGVTLPVIALTAQSSQADRQRALEAGFDSWLAKPIDPTVLAREVLRLARR